MSLHFLVWLSNAFISVGTAKAPIYLGALVCCLDDQPMIFINLNVEHVRIFLLLILERNQIFQRC